MSILYLCLILLFLWFCWLRYQLEVKDGKIIFFYVIGFMFIALYRYFTIFDLVVYFELIFWVFVLFVRKINITKHLAYVLSAPLIIYWGVELHYLSLSKFLLLSSWQSSLLVCFIFSRVWFMLKKCGKDEPLLFPLNLLIVYLVLRPILNMSEVVMFVLWPLLLILFLSCVLQFKNNPLRLHLYTFLFLTFSYNILSNSLDLFLYFYPIFLLYYMIIFLDEQRERFSLVTAGGILLVIFFPGIFFIKMSEQLLVMAENSNYVFQMIILWLSFIFYWLLKLDITAQIIKKTDTNWIVNANTMGLLSSYVLFIVWSSM